MPVNEIVAVFNMDVLKQEVSEEFFDAARREGLTQYCGKDEENRSFLISNQGVLLSPISCHSLKQRIDKKMFSREVEKAAGRKRE